MVGVSPAPCATQQYLLLSHPELSKKQLHPAHNSIRTGSLRSCFGSQTLSAILVPTCRKPQSNNTDATLWTPSESTAQRWGMTRDNRSQPEIRRPPLSHACSSLRETRQNPRNSGSLLAPLAEETALSGLVLLRLRHEPSTTSRRQVACSHRWRPAVG